MIRSLDISLIENYQWYTVDRDVIFWFYFEFDFQ